MHRFLRFTVREGKNELPILVNLSNLFFVNPSFNSSETDYENSSAIIFCRDGRRHEVIETFADVIRMLNRENFIIEHRDVL